jgi:oxygen-independent coproporphyrinogen III oxidase
MSNGAIHNSVERGGADMPAAPHLPAEGTPSSTSSAAESSSSTEALARAIRHIYVHIPFCARICPYCAFYKERADSSQAQRFCEAILRELERADARVSIQPQTIFFGGGTPTALTTAQLELLLSGFRGHLNLSEMIEWTVEANPGSVSPRKAELLRRLGVNRISLGVQSWNDQLLGVLGREHNAAQAEASFRMLRDAGFANLNIDLMFGVPGQTLADWQATLAKTIALQPEHISTYCLTYEEDTEFFIRQTRGELRADPDADAEFFQSAMQMLERTGYEQYEISNYARDGYASVHNRAYWAGENYLGLGPSAYSTVEMERWQNVPDYRAYSDRLLAGQSPITSIEALTPEMKRAEKIALSLRTQLGVPTAWLDPRPNERDEFIALGLLAESSGNLILTRKGKLLADSVAEAFI